MTIRRISITFVAILFATISFGQIKSIDERIGETMNGSNWAELRSLYMSDGENCFAGRTATDSLRTAGVGGVNIVKTNALAADCLDYYWFTSGTPTYLIEMLKKFQVMPSEIGSCEADKSEFDVALENMNSILPILYQSGYITIKGYDPETELFTLDIPNMEVKKAWMWLEDIYAFRKERRQL